MRRPPPIVFLIACLFVALLPLTPGSPQAKEGGGEPLRRIAFGSCAQQDNPQPIWGPIVATRPEIFLFIGDNFGLVTVDWERPDPRLSLQIRDVEGDITIQRKINLSTLQPGAIQ